MFLTYFHISFYLGPLRISVFVTVGVTLAKLKYLLLLLQRRLAALYTSGITQAKNGTSGDPVG